jgi:hypothetical protein
MHAVPVITAEATITGQNGPWCEIRGAVNVNHPEAVTATTV